MKIKTIFADRLYVFHYDGMTHNELQRLFLDWTDVEFLFNFFEENINDLQSGFYGNISVDDAVISTLREAQLLEEFIYDNRENKKFRFHELFDKNLNKRKSPLIELIPKKAYGPFTHSWLRLYAIEVSKECYIVTGGAIKLTRKMLDRKHTSKEIDKMNMCLNYLKDNGLFDIKGINETIEFD